MPKKTKKGLVYVEVPDDYIFGTLKLLGHDNEPMAFVP